MSIQLDRIGWEDEPSTATPIDSGNLKKMEENTQKAISEVEQIAINNVMTAFIDAAPPRTDTLTKISLTKSVFSGDKLTLSNGGVKIGAGISKVLISGQITPSGQINTSMNIAIYKNEEQVARSVTAAVELQASLQIVPKLIEVNEGDIIYLYFLANNVDLTPSEGLTFMTVQAV